MTTQTITVTSTINYALPNGPKVIYPGTAGYQRMKFDSRSVEVKDIRGTEHEYNLDKNGFQVVKGGWTETQVDDSNAKIKATVYPETVALVKKLTGATEAICFSHQVRCQTLDHVKESANGHEDSEVLPSGGPAGYAHCDNTRQGALEILKDNLPATDFSERTGNRFGIINVWRPIERPVTREPLAMLNAETVKDDDFVAVYVALPRPGQGAFDNFYNAGEGFQVAQIRANAKHEWCYLSDMTPDEAFVFKQYDSKKDGRARQTPHSAIQRREDHGPARQSIEVRCMLFWANKSVD